MSKDEMSRAEFKKEFNFMEFKQKKLIFDDTIDQLPSTMQNFILYNVKDELIVDFFYSWYLDRQYMHRFFSPNAVYCSINNNVAKKSFRFATLDYTEYNDSFDYTITHGVRPRELRFHLACGNFKKQKDLMLRAET